jgi:hypothetical protein
MNYYKNLFGATKEGNFYMDESQTDDIPQVSSEENALLIKHNKAPGPDGFSAKFYQIF